MVILGQFKMLPRLLPFALAALLASPGFGCLKFPDGPFRCASNADCKVEDGDWCDTERSLCVSLSDEDSVATELTKISGTGQIARVTETLAEPFLVRVLDQRGEPIGGHTITFAIHDSPAGAVGQGLSSATVVSSGDGNASTVLTLGNKAGTYEVVATAEGDLVGSPASFLVMATAGVPSELQQVSGDGQTGYLAQTLDPLVVRAVDAHGNPVANQLVEFAFDSGPVEAAGHSLSPATASTGADGETESVLTLGNLLGLYLVRASATIDGHMIATAFRAIACESVPCGGGEICGDDGLCGTCCSTVDCSPGWVCDEELCRSVAGNPDADPCVESICDPICSPEQACDPDTLECVAKCLVLGCPEVHQRCNTFTGDCEARAPEQGEIGWPCASQDDCEQGETACGLRGFCTKVCDTDPDCGAGAFCVPTEIAGQGRCWAACDPFWRDDCATGTQCASFHNLERPACYPFFDISRCPGHAPCIPRGSPCDPDQSDQCANGLSCVRSDDERGICRQVQCELPRGGCSEADELCRSVGSGLSFCAGHCDLLDLRGCPNGLSCVPGPLVQTFESKWAIALTSSGCPPSLTESHTIDGGVICHEGCEGGATCPAGMFCHSSQVLSEAPEVSGCVSSARVSGGCAACGALACTHIPSRGISICHVGCTTDAECTSGGEKLGRCTRITVSSGEHIQLCTYGSQGASCGNGCSSHTDCGHCRHDEDCPSFESQAGGTLAMKCDQYTSTCRKPTTQAQAPLRCAADEVFEPDGITDAVGNTSGACGLACENDTKCPGSCGLTGFCVPVTNSCNLISGQCEALCRSDASCIHGVCVEDSCRVGCTSDDDCGGQAVCHSAPPTPSYCALPNTTIREVRQNMTPETVTVEGIVTARHRRGGGAFDLFIQSTGAGPYDGIMVKGATTDALPGDKIWVTGQYSQEEGMDKLVVTNVTIVHPGFGVPAPISVDPATIANADPGDAFAHQSLLLRVTEVALIAYPMVDDESGPDGDFKVTGELIIGTLFPHFYDSPSLTDTFDSITGVLRHAVDRYRLEPRDNKDIVFTGGVSPDCTQSACEALGAAFRCEAAPYGQCVLGCTHNGGSNACGDLPLSECNECPGAGSLCTDVSKECDGVAICQCDTLNCESGGMVCDSLQCACVSL